MSGFHERILKLSSRLFLLGSILTLLIGLAFSQTPTSEQRAENDMQIEITFWRDEISTPACLEYSWVPQGQRRNIQLSPGERDKTVRETLPSDLNPSHVEVYVTYSGGAREGTEKWQFPPGPPANSPIKWARVEIYTMGMDREVRGVMHYEDGITTSSVTELQYVEIECPTGL